MKDRPRSIIFFATQLNLSLLLRSSEIDPRHHFCCFSLPILIGHQLLLSKYDRGLYECLDEYSIEIVKE